MTIKHLHKLETPYEGISNQDYQIEKRRLQVELLKIQQRFLEEKKRLAVVFEGRDAAGKGSTIKRFIENLMPMHFHVVALGVPTPKESKYWFHRYQKYFPKPGEIVFFDRSWYTRALIEPTMGYCTEKQYKYFMKKVLKWEHKHIDDDLVLVKFYLSVDQGNQLYRFEERLSDPLTYWKFSQNDLKARKKWEVFTDYKNQMFKRCSSEKSPWIVINGNKKREARLTAMLYLVRMLGKDKFEPMTGKDVTKDHSLEIHGIKFKKLSLQQLAVLEDLVKASDDQSA